MPATAAPPPCLCPRSSGSSVQRHRAPGILPRYSKVRAQPQGFRRFHVKTTEADMARSSASSEAPGCHSHARQPCSAEGDDRRPSRPRWWMKEARVPAVQSTRSTAIHQLRQRHPLFAVSIAYLIDHEPVIGVVYSPITDESFYAARGAGASYGGTERCQRRHPPVAHRHRGVNFKASSGHHLGDRASRCVRPLHGGSNSAPARPTGVLSVGGRSTFTCTAADAVGPRRRPPMISPKPATQLRRFDGGMC